MPSLEVIVIGFDDEENVADNGPKLAVENTQEGTEHTSENTEQCPGWLIDSLDALAKEYPNDRFEVAIAIIIVGKITEVPINDLLLSGQSFFEHLKLMKLPRITCADCPGEPHIPAPGRSAETFAAHLKTFLHRTKVELAITAGQERVNSAVSGRATTPASHRLAYLSLSMLPSNCTQVARRISEKD